MTMEAAQFTIALIVFLGTVAVGFWYIKSAVVRAHNSELKALAETRGNRVGDLEQTVKRLEAKVAKLEQQMDAMESIKGQEIALEVVKALRGDEDVEIHFRTHQE